MSASHTPSPEGLAEVLRELLALSQSEREKANESDLGSKEDKRAKPTAEGHAADAQSLST